MRQRVVQRPDHLRRRPFLRTKYRRSASFADQGVGHIAGHFNSTVCQPLIQPAKIDMRKACQFAAARPYGLRFRIQQFYAQRLHHACATVIGRAASNANNDMLYARIQRMTDQFPGSPGGGD
ncbi:Uncharacterised protein [Enterobacter cloacae]|nr:Uncharacterised protein [Enterobacter cloacae]